MVRNARFWAGIAAFQVVFGIAVFAVTRSYYLGHPVNVSAQPSTIAQRAPLAPGDITAIARSRLSHSSSGDSNSQDPAELSRQADQYFTSQQYDLAAQSYERLLALRPGNADVLNELGLTLHYLGRSDEALRRLNEGVTADPTHQRIRLTLGYVNSQLGNTKEARAALTAATQIGTDEEIRQSALTMLKNLP